ATDHAPHSKEEKFTSFTKASFGIVGLETAFALTMTELVETGVITLRQMVEKLSVNPAKILNISKGCIAEGWIADLVIADPEAVYNIDAIQFYSKGKHSPFDGRKVKGRITHTFVKGKLKYHDERYGN
ncbi:MAG TPA: amidohydrolase family protein, partial [Clostridiales bacterium]|nr:amidohydrolase family protein [Clostridiales bacterium]